MNLQHLNISPEAVSPYVLLPGDPARVDFIGTFLDQFSILANTREFRIGTGTYKNTPATVCSTGIGCPSTAIAVEELISAGARVLIRVGTCGGAWRREIPAGSLIIPTAAIRDEGTTREYIPLGFPAIADLDVVTALRNAAVSEQSPFVLGLNRTHDAFYGTQDSVTKWGTYLTDKRWKDTDSPILSSDMETAALFVIALLRGVKAGAILTVNADPEPLQDRVDGKTLPVVADANPELTKATLARTIRIALNALSSFSPSV
ncbi:MAG: nucleoside phosphorylase [Candidatus Kerfeldbacteria bacterium]|nr:nucleoside phosphorylase [Candidatus Kerfeldbacteria bacterium]